MKKILILLLMLFLIPLSITKTKAEIIDPDFPQYYYQQYELEPYTFFGDWDGLIIVEQAVYSDSHALFINLPADTDRIASGGGNTSKISLYDSITASWISVDISDLLLPGDAITDAFSLTIRYNTTSAFGDLSGKNITKFSIYVLLAETVSAFGERYSYYAENAEIYAPVLSFVVRYIDRLEIIGTQTILGYPVVFSIPTRAADPTGYEFVGWRNRDGDFISFDEETANWDVNSNFEIVGETVYLNVYAYYRHINTGLFDEPTATPDDPGGILTILAEFGLATTTGLTIVFIVVLFFLFIVMALLKLPLIIYFIVGLGVTVLFMFLGFLPIYISIISILLLVITFFSIRTMGGGVLDE